MGLAGAKNKRKLGNDPNNTKWSRNTDTFGQKILRAQGWTPGEYLGVKDAPHAEWHTEASSSHIRVVLKDDTMGLGAKRNNGDECVGLDAFQMLLGRLNGKSDEALETEQKARDDIKINAYVARKIGVIRFVKGGWLVGDQLQETPDEEVAKLEVSPVSEESKEATEEKGSKSAGEKSKKRKADQSTDEEEEKARKKEKKSKKRKAESGTEAESESAREKKDRKSKKRRSEDDPSGKKGKKDKEAVTEDSSVSETGDSSAAEAKEAKKERKRLRQEKREKKAKRRKDRAEAGDSISKEKKRRKNDGEASSASTPTDTPSGSGYSTPVTTSSRYLARSRFIAQKRMAFADTAALNQIFMIKS